MTNYKSRQNDPYAIKLIKAASFCKTKEYTITYISIVFSTMFCLMGIALSMYAYYMKLNDIIDDNQIIPLLSKLLALISGSFLAIQIILSYFSYTYNVDNTNLEERYDNFVYEIKPNQVLLKPLSEIEIDEYAKRVKKENEYYKDFYWNDVTENISIHKNQIHVIYEIYEMIAYARKVLFYKLWFGLIGLIVLTSLVYGVEVSFVDVIIGVLIPSLSIINMIIGSMLKYHRSRKILHNGLNVIDKIDKEKSTTKYTEYDVRTFQDFIFYQRLNEPMIPMFIRRMFKKKKQKLVLEVVQKKLLEEAATKQIKITQPAKTIKKTITKAKISKK